MNGRSECRRVAVNAGECSTECLMVVVNAGVQ